MQIDDKKVEAAARALFDFDATGYPASNAPWEDQPKSVRARYVARARAALATLPVPAGAEAVAMSAEREWQELLEKDDRTSPAEYPEMALITFEELREIIAAARSALVAPASLPDGWEVHPDDVAVDRFAAAMKAKLAKKRGEGRGGWSEDNKAIGLVLSRMLRKHVEKGDPVDVGNLAMMIHQRGERVAAERETSE